MDLSIVIPLLNEDESLPELYSWIKKVVNENNISHELIFVDDGSTDNSWQVINGFINEDNNVRGIKFRRNYGKSAALNTGFKRAEGDVVITMDADLQDSPDEIPELVKMIKEDGFDIVSGWKKKRYDPITKTIPTKLYNLTTRIMTGVKLHDMNCGLKAYSNSVVKSIDVYGEMHRYIPVIAKYAGYKKIGEKVVHHQARKFGVTKFGGLKRFIHGPLDLLSIIFIGRFSKKPMHLFGGMGILSFLAGFVIAIYLIIAKFVYEVYHMTDRPLFYLCLLLMVIGCMLFLTGFLAELISRNSPERNTYLVEKDIKK